MLAGPAIRYVLARRQAAGKEDVARIHERFGVSECDRPDGLVVWIHAASVGEAESALPLMEGLLAARPDIHILLTTGTVTSARILADRLPARALHQFVPADRPVWVRRFLDHWQPGAAIWIESEFWPNLLLQTAERGIPVALVNARISERSFARWKRVPKTIGQLLGCFDLILARDRQVADFLHELGAERVIRTGDLKQAAGPLPADENALGHLRSMIGTRPVWLAASTHAGEEQVALTAHLELRQKYPDLLTIIAPRHAGRGVEIAEDIVARGLRVARRSKGEVPGSGTDIYLADTMGEMGMIYRLAPVAFVGGSLVAHGGQNPLEPARLSRAILHGPHVANFAGIYAALEAAGGSREVVGNPAMEVDALLQPGAAEKMGQAASRYANDAGAGVLEEIMEALTPLLPERG